MDHDGREGGWPEWASECVVLLRIDQYGRRGEKSRGAVRGRCRAILGPFQTRGTPAVPGLPFLFE